MFLLFGISFFGIMLTMLIVPEWRANHSYIEHRCTILDKRLAEHPGDDGPTYRPEFRVKYTVIGKDYDVWIYDAGNVYSGGRAGKQAILDQFVVGREYPCWYDPTAPAKSVLVRGYSWFAYLFLPLSLVFAAVGVFGLRATYRKTRPMADASTAAKTTLPGMPDPLPTDTGTKLAVALRPARSAGAELVGLLIALLVCGGLAVAFEAIAWHLQGAVPPQWIGGVCFGAVGLAMALAAVAVGWQVVRQSLIVAKVGPLRLEAAQHPIRPGETVALLVSQAGPLRVRSLRVRLLCEESATYREGTDSRTESKCVLDRELLAVADFAVEYGQAYEGRCDVAVSAGAMHSFQSDNNAVRWKLVVAVEPVDLPAFTRNYPVLVYPAVVRAQKGGPS